MGVHKPVQRLGGQEAVTKQEKAGQGRKSKVQSPRMVPQDLVPSRQPGDGHESCMAAASRGRPGPSHPPALWGGDNTEGNGHRGSSTGPRTSGRTQTAASESTNLGKGHGRLAKCRRQKVDSDSQSLCVCMCVENTIRRKRKKKTIRQLILIIGRQDEEWVIFMYRSSCSSSATS